MAARPRHDRPVARRAPRAGLRAVAAALSLVAVAVVGHTGSEFSAATTNGGNTFSAAATFSSNFASATVVNAAATSATYASTVVADGPTGYWRLGEATGTPMSDASGNGYHGSWLDSDARGAEGAVGDGDLAGKWRFGDLASRVPHVAAFNQNGAFSTEFWLKVPTLNTAYGGARIVLADEWRFQYVGTGALQFQRAQSGQPLYSSPAGVMSTGAYRHIVLTYDGTTVRWYVDGALATATAGTLPSVTGGPNLSVGNLSGNSSQEEFHLDDVALYGSVLSAAQVQNHASIGRMLRSDSCSRYRIYANVTDQGSPPTGVTSVTANVATVTTGGTAVALAPGSWTVGGTTYGYRSAPLRADVAAGSYSYSVTSVDAAGSHTQSGLSTSVATPAATTTTWITGLEAGVLETPNLFSSSSGATVTSAVARTGTASLAVAKTSGASVYAGKAGFTPTTDLSFAVRLATLPTADVTSLAYLNTSATPLYLGYQSATNRFTLRWGANTAAVGTAAVTAGTWYSVELKVDTSANPNTAAWQVDALDQPGASLAAAAQTVTDFRFGSAVSADVFTVNYDDVLHSTALGTYPLGPVKVVARRPNGNGTHSEPEKLASTATGQTVDADSTAWSVLDDPVMDNTTDAVRQTASSGTAYAGFAVADTTDACVRGVQAVVAQHKLAAQTNVMTTTVASGTVESVVTSGDGGGGGALAIRTAVVAPVTAPWTPAAFNALQFRTGYSTDVNPEPRWDALLLEYATAG